MATAVIDLPVWGASLPSSSPALYKRAEATQVFDTLRFLDSIEMFAYWRFRAVGYTSGNPLLRIRWYADTAISGDVIFGCQIACITPNTDTDDTDGKTFASTQTVTDSHLGTTAQRLHECTLTITNLDSLAADDEVFLRFERVGNDSGDTLTGDILLESLQVEYTVP